MSHSIGAAQHRSRQTILGAVGGARNRCCSRSVSASGPVSAGATRDRGRPDASSVEGRFERLRCDEEKGGVAGRRDAGLYRHGESLRGARRVDPRLHRQCARLGTPDALFVEALSIDPGRHPRTRPIEQAGVLLHPVRLRVRHQAAPRLPRHSASGHRRSFPGQHHRADLCRVLAREELAAWC